MAMHWRIYEGIPQDIVGKPYQDRLERLKHKNQQLLSVQINVKKASSRRLFGFR